MDINVYFAYVKCKYFVNIRGFFNKAVSENYNDDIKLILEDLHTHM